MVGVRWWWGEPSRESGHGKAQAVQSWLRGRRRAAGLTWRGERWRLQVSLRSVDAVLRCGKLRSGSKRDSGLLSSSPAPSTTPVTHMCVLHVFHRSPMLCSSTVSFSSPFCILDHVYRCVFTLTDLPFCSV